MKKVMRNQSFCFGFDSDFSGNIVWHWFYRSDHSLCSGDYDGGHYRRCIECTGTAKYNFLHSWYFSGW